MPLYGDVNTLAPFWGAVNWNERFVSAANPNMLYFNDDGSANVNNEAGVRAFTELLKSLEYHGPGALEKDWLAQYQLMGAGNGFRAARSRTRRSSSRATPTSTLPESAQFIKSDVMPGRVVDGVLIRRPVIFYNICYGVNAFADPSHHEATYLFLQWAGGARMYTYLTAQRRRLPGSAPHLHAGGSATRRQSYKPQPLGQFAEDHPAHGTADHAQGRRRLSRRRSARRSRRS